MRREFLFAFFGEERLSLSSSFLFFTIPFFYRFPINYGILLLLLLRPFKTVAKEAKEKILVIHTSLPNPKVGLQRTRSRKTLAFSHTFPIPDSTIQLLTISYWKIGKTIDCICFLISHLSYLVAVYVSPRRHPPSEDVREGCQVNVPVVHWGGSAAGGDGGGREEGGEGGGGLEGLPRKTKKL